MTPPDLFVTNFNRRLTGVSTTIANLLPVQARDYDLRLVGQPLPLAPDPISTRTARQLSRRAPNGRPFAIWHVRRDPEMQAGIWARDVLRLPIRLVFTSAAQRRHSAIPRWLIGRMDAVISTTDLAASLLDRDSHAIVPHGIDIHRFTPAQDRLSAWQDLGYGGKRGVVIVGRVRPDKGTDVFVDAMIPVLQNDPEAVGLVIGLAKRGDQAFEAALKQRAQAAGVGDRLRFTGVIDNGRELPRILRGASLVANLARHEEFGVVPLEGMASGTPFVCSQTGAYPYLSQGGANGLIAPVGDAHTASQMIAELLSDPQRIEAMGRAGRSFVEGAHAVEHEAAGIHQVYERLWSGDIAGR